MRAYRAAEAAPRLKNLKKSLKLSPKVSSLSQALCGFKKLGKIGSADDADTGAVPLIQR